jgi:hypothetical protein
MAYSGIAFIALAAAQAAAPAQGVQWKPLTPNAPAQSPATGPVAAATPAVAPAARYLPAATMISLTPLEEISSKHIKEGQRFRFTVVNDITENGAVVIPRGSMATGVVSMQTGRAIGGKSGKFDITFEQVQANGVTFPLMGVHRQEGKGNTVGALFGSILISGRSAVMLPGQVVTAMTKDRTAY